MNDKNIFWHALSHDTLFAYLQSSSEGLDSSEIELRKKKFGPNTLYLKPAEHSFWIFLRQFHNSLIYILLASTALALFLGKITDAAVVFSVIIINTLIGFVQEYRSSRTIQALLKMVPQSSNVLRGGILLSIPSSELVPGDIIVLQAGDRIAADIRLFSVKNLGCDESALTGESLPVLKRGEAVAEETPLPDRKSMAYNGTLVTSGTGMGVVVAIGLKTEFGKISQLLEEVSTLETPLTHTLSHIARWVTTTVFLMGIGLFVVGYIRGYTILDALLASIALVVAAIPEGLPATITITAAIGVQRMARRKAIIRNMLAVETLGSTTVICTDKTGTLTQNEMTVQSIWTPKSSFFVTGIGYSFDGEIICAKESQESKESLKELLTAVILCNDASIEQREEEKIINGDPTEIALLIASRKGALSQSAIREQWPRIDAIPFESERRIMATLHKKTIFLKGAPEAVIKICRVEELSSVYEEIEKMAKQGMRLVAIAKKELSSEHLSLEEEDIREGFTLLGVMGMMDPPRKDVANAIKACQRAGIAVKMITGDHPLTASVIGSELGLESEGRSILGGELDQLDGEELQRVVNESVIFARALPEHKLKIVKALQAYNHVVAMTGDGVNDAPALKRANIGVAMGISGTAVAKEASDMVLVDDNFASIEAAVEEGRRVYDNLIKSIAFLFPTNLAQAIVILIAVLFFPIYNESVLLPILPVQILWINLVVAVALALPLAFEAMEPDIMQRPPRDSRAPILSKFIILRTMMVVVIMVIGTMGLFSWQYFRDLARGVDAERALSEARTMAVTTLTFFQVFYLLNCRSLRFSIFKIGFFSNLYVLCGIGFVTLAQLSFVYLPFMNRLFSSSALLKEGWIISIAVALIILPIIAFEKWMVRRFSYSRF